MRIAVLTTSYPRRAGDYFGNYIHHVAREHTVAGHRVQVVAPHTRGAATRESIEGVYVLRFRYALPSFETLAYGGGVFTVLRRSLLAKLLLPGFALAFTMRAAGTVRRCDVVHAHWTLAGLVGVVLAKVFHKRLVLTVYGIEVFTGRFSPLTRLCLRRSSRVICISSATAAKTREISPELANEKITIIPYGVPADVLNAPEATIDVRTRHGIADSTPVVLSVGRLIERKGLEYLLRALATLRERFDVRAFIVGDGPERQRLERLATELGIAGAVTFAGAVPSSDLPAYYDACDVFAHPVVTDATGDVEGLGLVLLEAMARGRPVVASGAGGITDVVVDGETGLLVPERDAAALAGRIEALVADRTLRERLGAAGRQRVVERFSVPTLAARIADVYAGLEA